MNTKIVAILLTVCIAITACAVYITGLVVNKGIENPLEGIVFEIKENTLTNTGFTLIIKNATPNNYEYGSPYQIEEKINDEWITKVSINGYWTSELRYLSKNSIKEEGIKYVELNPGNYRFTKTFTYLTPAGNSEHYPISVEFTIN